MSKPSTEPSSTAPAQEPVAFQKANQDQCRVESQASSSSTGLSILSVTQTIVVRALRGPSVTVPFNVDQELSRRANRNANCEPEPGSSTSNSF